MNKKDHIDEWSNIAIYYLGGFYLAKDEQYYLDTLNHPHIGKLWGWIHQNGVPWRLSHINILRECLLLFSKNEIPFLINEEGGIRVDDAKNSFANIVYRYLQREIEVPGPF